MRSLASKLPFLYYAISVLVVKLLALVPGFYKRERTPTTSKLSLALEAGEDGWESIEIKELHSSACEYFGDEAISCIRINKQASYYEQVYRFVSERCLTHYMYDPRSARTEAENSYGVALVDSLLIAIILARFRVTPVVYLTDFGYRKWRCQAAAVSSSSGVVVTLMMPKMIGSIFPHQRLVGPSLMPFSVATLQTLNELKSELVIRGETKNVVRFTGSLYEPRESFLRNFQLGFGERVEIVGRKAGAVRLSDADYWKLISSANIVITTADQVAERGRDVRHIPHLVYRYLEVLASGSLLIAPIVPGIERYFSPNIHFVAFSNLEEALVKAEYYLENVEKANSIALVGHGKASSLIRSHAFWLQIDAALGTQSFFGVPVHEI
jgi:hypothetical protein